jgi:hypothetical protein
MCGLDRKFGAVEKQKRQQNKILARFPGSIILRFPRARIKLWLAESISLMQISPVPRTFPSLALCQRSLRF